MPHGVEQLKMSLISLIKWPAFSHFKVNIMLICLFVLMRCPGHIIQNFLIGCPGIPECIILTLSVRCNNKINSGLSYPHLLSIIMELA